MYKKFLPKKCNGTYHKDQQNKTKQNKTKNKYQNQIKYQIKSKQNKEYTNVTRTFKHKNNVK